MQSSSGNATTSAWTCARRRCAPATGRRGAEDLESDRATGSDFHEPVVAVLVDEDHSQPRIFLRLQRIEEPGELVSPPDRRHDEIERRRLRRHGP